MVKFHLFCVLTLCACLAQICAGHEDAFDFKGTEEFVREEVYGVGDKFVVDFVKLLEKYQNNDYILGFLGKTVEIICKKIPNDQNSKINVNQVKDYNSQWTRDSAIVLEELKICQSIMSKQLPPEQYNGLLNLRFTCVDDNATTEEIQSALNYLYGVDVEATKTSFLDAHNIQNPTFSAENDCPYVHEWYSSTIDKLRDLVSIKPKVMQDFLAIRETFPCNGFVQQSLDHFVHKIEALDADKSKINACMIKENPRNWERAARSKVYLEQLVEGPKTVLSTRLPDETIRGIINFKRATIPDTPIDDIEKALEYLYDDVPKTDCPTATATESSTDLE